MRKFLFLFFLAVSSKIFGETVLIIEPHIIPQNEAWKYGVSSAEKVIGNRIYTSITINPKLLCEVETVEVVGWLTSEVGHKLPVLSAASAYTVDYPSARYSNLDFTISCATFSNVHVDTLFKYVYSR